VWPHRSPRRAEGNGPGDGRHRRHGRIQGYASTENRPAWMADRHASPFSDAACFRPSGGALTRPPALSTGSVTSPQAGIASAMPATTTAKHLGHGDSLGSLWFRLLDTIAQVVEELLSEQRHSRNPRALVPHDRSLNEAKCRKRMDDRRTVCASRLLDSGQVWLLSRGGHDLAFPVPDRRLLRSSDSLPCTGHEAHRRERECRSIRGCRRSQRRRASPH
jgi:hypothetical protein